MAIRPIVIDKKNMILGGNQRYKAIEALDMKEIPDNWVIKAENLTPAQRRRFIVVDNAPDGMAGEWDLDLLNEDWSIPELAELGLDMPEMKGFDFSDLDSQMNELGDIEDTNVVISVPKRDEAQVKAWLADGESLTAPGMGKGVLRRCGLL